MGPPDSYTTFPTGIGTSSRWESKSSHPAAINAARMLFPRILSSSRMIHLQPTAIQPRSEALAQPVSCLIHLCPRSKRIHGKRYALNDGGVPFGDISVNHPFQCRTKDYGDVIDRAMAGSGRGIGTNIGAAARRGSG